MLRRIFSPIPIFSSPHRTACAVACALLAVALLFTSAPPLHAAAKKATAPPAAPAPEAVDPFPSVVEKAQKRAGRSYKPAENQAPDFVRALSESQWKTIQFNPARNIWKNKDTPFGLELHHPGSIYDRLVAVNIVDGDKAGPLEFSPDMFIYGSNNKSLAERVKQTPPGFAGFRLTHPLANEQSRDVITSFLGATYFRGAGKYSVPGVHARALALNTALPDGEEIPYFREFWIVTPRPGDTSVIVCALLESPNVTGAYRFAITPGTSTVMSVEARIFLRKDARWPQKIGTAPLTSMFLYSETDNGRPGEYRPEVHNSDGLLFSTDENIWNWAPLVNPSRLVIDTFPLENPRGFGLLQRDADFDHYQDIANRFDRKASVWIEPQGDWGSGRIEIIEIPSTEEIHDNITAFWVPDAISGDGDATAQEKALSLAYKIYWMTPGVTPHALGRVTATRLVRTLDTARFYLDFESEALKTLPEDFGLTSLVETPENAPIIGKHLTKNPATGGWRLVFSVKLPRPDSVVQSIISARDGSSRLRFRALLKKGENLPDPLTEVWVYDLPL